MPATEAERSKAKRLRKKKSLSSADARWLAAYKRDREQELATKAAPSIEAAASTLSDEPDTGTTRRESETSAVEVSPTVSGSAASDPEMELVEVYSDPSTEPGYQEPPHISVDDLPVRDPLETTTMREAPSGSGGQGIIKLPKKRPMSENGARAIAGGILSLLGFAIKLFRSDRRIIPPTEKEIDEFAKAIKEIADTRAPWLSSFDDFMAAGWILAKYAGRAIGAPNQKQLPKGDAPSVEVKT